MAASRQHSARAASENDAETSAVMRSLMLAFVSGFALVVATLNLIVVSWRRAGHFGDIPMRVLDKVVPLAVYGLIRFLLGGYFRRIEVFHAERVPKGPVIFAVNHPGSVTDGFVVGTCVPRRAHFLATAQLFRLPPLAWLLRTCGIIPLNRKQDDPTAMRSVADSFASAFRVLERGEAVVIFPEGITYDDAQLKSLKSGAARLALELEHRHGGNLGLQIIPIGLTYSAKDRYRSEVLVYFGQPINVAGFLPQYTERRKECISGLTAKIERRLQSLLVHLPQMERAHTVEIVKRLYLQRLRLGNSVIVEPVSALAEEVILTQAISDAADFAHQEMPERMAAFLAQHQRYERLLKQLRLSDGAVEELADNRHIGVARTFGLGSMAIVLFPVALIGWLHWRPPTRLIESLTRRFMDPKKRKAQTAHSSMLAGIFIYGVSFAFYGMLAFLWLGLPVAGWYALGLPVTGLIGHFYFGEIRRLAAALRTSAILLRAPVAKRRVLRIRSALVREIESMRKVYRQSRPADRILIRGNAAD